MPSYRRSYRRIYQPGGIYFFTLVLADRSQDSLTRHIDLLRSALLEEKHNHPFALLAWVVLPDHLHMLWRLPADDSDYPNRLRRFKARFARQLPATEAISDSRRAKQERGIWQRRYWEHLIREGDDLQRHIDYIHFNPVKHGLVSSPKEWPHSSFAHFVAKGLYPWEWGAAE